MMRDWGVGLLCAAVLATPASAADIDAETLQVDQAQVDAWNAFADALYNLHQQRLVQRTVRTSEQIGGYGAGVLGEPDFYREVRYYDADSGRLLSRIQWERERPNVIHMIEVLLYDAKGRVQRDYLAAYLPKFRNAPVQTLINFHNYEEGLHAYRQFDASGNRIYEQCSGTYFGEKVFLSLEERDLPPFADDPKLLDSHTYLACFESLPLRAGPYLDPLVELGRGSGALAGTDVEAEQAVAALSARIEQSPSAQAYLARGQRYFELGRFEAALQDFDRALAADEMRDEAHFWRGMVLGRMGRLEDSIAALDAFIARNPMNSLAYTKRGVRHIWNGDLARAEQDLKQAIALDPNNAEAHDDLGVVYAQREAYQQALRHFQKTVSIDPSYQKGHHNRAMVLYLTGRLEPALQSVNESQRLAPNDRGTVLLKGQILKAMGREQQAQALFERAQFMSEDKDWTEQFAVQ